MPGSLAGDLLELQIELSQRLGTPRSQSRIVNGA